MRYSVIVWYRSTSGEHKSHTVNVNDCPSAADALDTARDAVKTLFRDLDYITDTQAFPL